MSWLLVLLTAAGAVYFLVNARNESRARFEEILRREAEEQQRRNPVKPQEKKGSGHDRAV